MAITKTTEVAAVTVVMSGVLEVRTDLVVRDDDGSEIGRRPSRRTYEPSRDLTTVPAGKLRRIAAAVWDEATVVAWETRPLPQL
jgi:hypothetical protein